MPCAPPGAVCGPCRRSGRRWRPGPGAQLTGLPMAHQTETERGPGPTHVQNVWVVRQIKCTGMKGRALCPARGGLWAVPKVREAVAARTRGAAHRASHGSPNRDRAGTWANPCPKCLGSAPNQMHRYEGPCPVPRQGRSVGRAEGQGGGGGQDPVPTDSCTL